MESPKENRAHFKGKDAISHVAETQAQGILTSAEMHGTEAPDHVTAAADAARDTAIFLIIIGVTLSHINIPQEITSILLLAMTLGWLIWRCGRSGWLGWQNLERLHRVIAEEKWEIEHHRDQEREELYALYSAKGFSGKLLEDVVDVLMADNDRLLRVMIEEELNLSLEKREHPLKIAFGAGLGTLTAFLCCFVFYLILHINGLLIGAFLVSGVAGGMTAYYWKNRRIPAIVWNIGLAIGTYGFVNFSLELLL
ncbi:MAG: hypothetical protein Tsb0021_03440 [Chlamydiales bacterium]